MTQKKKSPSSPHGTQAWLTTVRAYNLCASVVAARLAEIGLRVADLEVLATLATTPGITQQELAARCFVTKSGISMLLTQMEAQHLVTRLADDGDARLKRLALTEEGEKLAAKAMQVQAEVVTAMVAGSSDEEIEMVGKMMERVASQLEGLQQSLKKRR